MTELVLSDFGTTLGRTGERFCVRRRDKAAQEFSAADVSHILIAGKGMSLSADAIAFAVEQGIPLTLLSFSGEPYARIASGNELSDAALRREQLFATRDPRGAALMCGVLSGKLRNQSATLRYFAKSRKLSDPERHAALTGAAQTLLGQARALNDYLGAPIDECRGSLMALEARAAREYWQAVAQILPEDLGFSGRIRKGAVDPVNAALNYGYGILYARVWAAVARVRLDPYAGFLHALQEGKPVFVFDLIEEFRAWTVDRVLFADLVRGWKPEMDEAGYMSQTGRKEVAQRILTHGHKRYRYHGKSAQTFDILLEQIRAVARFLREGAPYRPYLAPW